MDAGIRTTGAGQHNFLPGQFLDMLLEHFLYGHAIGLNLPSTIVCPIIGKYQFNPSKSFHLPALLLKNSGIYSHTFTATQIKI